MIKMKALNFYVVSVQKENQAMKIQCNFNKVPVTISRRPDEFFIMHSSRQLVHRLVNGNLRRALK